MNRLAKWRPFSAVSKIGLASALLGISIFWACHLDPNSTQESFKVAGDSAWTKCDSIAVELLDDNGKVLATLFKDTLRSLDELANLPADKYPGGKAKVHIFGWKNGASCFDQIRSFDDKGGKVVVDTFFDPSAQVLSVAIKPSTVQLTPEDSAVSVMASITPDFADPSFLWSIDNDKIASLQFPAGKNAGGIKIKGLTVGVAKVKARSKKDTTKYAEVTVHIDNKIVSSVTVFPDSIKLYVGGPGDTLHATVLPVGTNQGVEWSSDNVKAVEVDSQGHILPKGEGVAHIQAKSKIFGTVGTALVNVKRDLPILTVASRSGAAINVPIEFAANAVQGYGIITLFKMDFDGDGVWDDSLAGPWTGTSVDLPHVSSKYAKEGKFVAKFLVRDGEGNEAIALVSLDIGNQAPEILTISKDTTISIKDSLKLFAKVRDFEGKVAWAGWDFEGDGKFDDSVTTSDSVVDIVLGHRYLDVGAFHAVLKVKDEAGKDRVDTVKVNVVLDPPVADAGNDTTVMAGTFVQVHAKGTDKFGKITLREIQIGSGTFIMISQPDTAIRPPIDSGKFNVTVRVTDDDGNKAMDSMTVTVSTPDLSNNNLASLTPSVGSLTPSFKPVSLYYSVVLTFADSQIAIKATPSDTGAKMAINSKPTAAGEFSDPVKITVGTNVNVFQIVVTAQNGIQQFYSVSVTRAPNAEAQLSKLDIPWLSLKPSFTPETLDYTDTVANDVSSLTLKATASAVGAKVALNDTLYPSGTVSGPIALKVGQNKITIKVTAQDGKTTATYTVSVVRRAKLLVFRKLGPAAPVQTFSLEAPLGSLVNISAPDTLGFSFNKWILSNGAGVFQDSMSKATKVSIQSPIVSVTAKFDTTTYIISSTAGPGGLLTPSSKIVNHGMDFIVSVLPNPGYRILTFTDNGKDALDPTKTAGFFDTLKAVTEPHLLSVTFIRIYSLTAISTNPAVGTILPGPKPITVDSGTTRIFTLQSLVVGQYAKFLTDNSVDVAASLQGDPAATSTYTLTDIKTNHNITTTFAIKTLSISTKTEDKLRGTVIADSSSVGYGGKATVMITPAKGYRVLTVTDNGKDVFKSAQDQGFKYIITPVFENHVVIATFMRTYTLTGITNDPKLGTVDTAIVDSLDSRDLNLNSQFGQYVAGLTDNGKDALPNLANNVPGPATSTLTFKEVTEDHKVMATFAQKTYLMHVTGHDLCIRAVPPPCPIGQICLIKACLVGTGPDADSLKVPHGASYNISTADTLGTRPFTSWYQDGTPFATTTSITTPPITADVTFTANYRLVVKCCPGICCPIGGPGPILIDPIPMSAPLASPAEIPAPPLK